MKRKFIKFIAYNAIFSFLLILPFSNGNVFAAHSSTNVRWAGNSTEVDVTDPSLSTDWVVPVTNASIAWNNAGANWSFAGGTTGHQVKTARWDTPINPNLEEPELAITYVYPGVNPIIDRDTVFNTFYPWSTAGEPVRYDVQAVATHEFGHWLDLNDLHGSDDTELTMYYQIGIGETTQRTLETDDKQSIKQQYPFYVSGIISSNTTWASDTIQVIQGAVTVNPGVTLSIEPGTIVKFQDTSSSLNINGTLFAQGTPTSTIYFTSLKDDSVGGDTNGDGEVSSFA